jgi:cell shape-determining protein MreC
MDIPLTIAVGVGSALLSAITTFFAFKNNVEKKIQKLDDTKLGVKVMDDINKALAELLKGVELLKQDNVNISKEIGELKVMIKEQDDKLRENEKIIERIATEHDMVKSSCHNFGG